MQRHVQRRLFDVFWRQMSVSPIPSNVQNVMKTKLTNELNPVYVEIVNESSMHNVPKGAETHFKVVIVSETFRDMPLLERHRMVNKVLREEFQQSGMHALSIHAFTKEQWESMQRDRVRLKSPPCLGGSKHDH